VGVRGELVVQLEVERAVRRLREDGLLVEQLDDGGQLGVLLPLDQLAHAQVVKVLHLRPGDPLLRVLLLLRLERELDEVLLKLLIAVIDAQLLETIHGENLEAVDVKHANRPPLCRLRVVRWRAERLVQSAHERVEEARVDGLG